MKKLALTAIALTAIAGCGSTVSLGSVESGSTNGSVLGGSTTAGATPSSESSSTAGGQQLSSVPGDSGLGQSAVPTAAPSDGTYVPPAGASGSTASGPLTIGIAYVNNSGSSSSLGFSSGYTINQKAIVEAFVRGINAGGGIVGRQLKAVEYEFSGQASNYGDEATAACATFTQDNHVPIVIDAAFSTVGGFRDCLQKKGILDLDNQIEDNAASSSQARLHFNTMAMTTERTYSGVVREMVGNGYLTKKNQMGVIVENCPEDTTAYTKTIAPLISSYGLKKPIVEQIDCTVGFSSAAPAAAAINGAVLAFRNAGADRLMFVSGEEAVILGLFAQPANSQGYHPGYLLSSNAEVQAIRSTLPNPQRPGLHGAGNSPIQDVDGQPLSPADQQCLAILKRGGLAVGKDADVRLALFHCGGFALLEQAMQKTNGISSPSALVTAIESLGSSFVAPGIVNGAESFGPSKHDGPDYVRAFAYVASCNCMRYTGPAHRA